MALRLNLLHEEILETRQRQRDPLKIGMLALSACGVLMALYYMWNGYQTLGIRSRLNGLQREWAKVEPSVTAAQKRSKELSNLINTTKVLDGIIDGRFFWAPFLEKLSRSVAINSQLTSLDGAVLDDNRGVSVTIEGVAAGREPRAAAEELRAVLSEQLRQSYREVKVEFKTLEDLDTIASIGGGHMPMARYVLIVNFNPFTAAVPSPSLGRKPAQK